MNLGISGASGHLGAAIVGDLLRRGGHTITGISRTPERVPAAAQARFGDYDQPASLARAYAGLDRLVIIPSPVLEPTHRASQNTAAIAAAIEAGVDHIVFVSFAGTRKATMPDILTSYWAGEQQLMRTAPSWTILRMNYYAELFVQEAQFALLDSALAGLGENRVAFVSRDDVAAAAEGILTGDGHDGAIYHATGPTSLSGAQRAMLVTAATNRPLEFLVLSEVNLRAALMQQMPDDAVDAMISIQRHQARGDFDIVTGDVERLAGRPPRALEDMLSDAIA